MYKNSSFLPWNNKSDRMYTRYFWTLNFCSLIRIKLSYDFFAIIKQNKIKIFSISIFSHCLKISQNTGPGKDEKKLNAFNRQ